MVDFLVYEDVGFWGLGFKRRRGWRGRVIKEEEEREREEKGRENRKAGERERGGGEKEKDVSFPS